MKQEAGNTYYLYYFYSENKICHPLTHLRQYTEWRFFFTWEELIDFAFLLEIYWIVTAIILSHTNIVDELT